MAKLRTVIVKSDTTLVLEYAEHGAGHRAVIFLHGYGDSWYSFHGMLEAWPHDWRVLSLSQRGYGESSKPPAGYSVAQYAADVIAFMDAMEVHEAIVVGHSMGSLIAQEMAITFPARVRQLILIASAASGDNAVLRHLYREVGSLRDPIDRGFIRAFQAGTCANSMCHGMSLETIVDESIKSPSHVWRQALEGLLNYRPANVEDSLEISCPTLIMWGDQDEIFLRDDQELLRSLISGAQLTVCSGAGHALQWERPIECVEHALRFLSSNIIDRPSLLSQS